MLHTAKRYVQNVHVHVCAYMNVIMYYMDHISKQVSQNGNLLATTSFEVAYKFMNESQVSWHEKVTAVICDGLVRDAARDSTLFSLMPLSAHNTSEPFTHYVQIALM